MSTANSQTTYNTRIMNGVRYALTDDVLLCLDDVLRSMGAPSVGGKLLPDIRKHFAGNPLYGEVGTINPEGVGYNVDTTVFKVERLGIPDHFGTISHSKLFINTMMLYWLLKHSTASEAGVFSVCVFSEIFPQIIAEGGRIALDKLSDQVTRTAFANSFTPVLSEGEVRSLLLSLGGNT